jgi:hypothetical protein
MPKTMSKIELNATPAKKYDEVHIALDFDATLADYKNWDSQGNVVGKPIKRMVENAKEWLKKGYKISIFTARLSHGYAESEKQIVLIQKFLKENGLPTDLQITCMKMHYFTIFIDDKSYHCIPNTGVIEGNTGL